MEEASASSKPDVPTNFLSLPRELRDLIYAYVLVNEEYIDLGTWIYPPLSPQLLRTNKIIYDEATKVLYTYNRFNFALCHSDDILPSFLDQIGPDNSKHIRHIRIDFPTFQYLDLGDVTLTDKSVRILEKLKDCCGNLRTLTTSRSSTDNMERKLNNLEHPKAVTEALKLVDTRFRAISSQREMEGLTTASCQPSQSRVETDSGCILAHASSLPLPDHNSGSSMLSIVVEVYEDCLNDDIRRKMESHGWVLNIAENLEEEDRDRGFSDIDFDINSDDWDRDDGDDDDDYDIDNDSDFWRRAGD